MLIFNKMISKFISVMDENDITNSKNVDSVTVFNAVIENNT